MSIIMRVGFEKSDDLRMWLCASNQNWIIIGDAIISDSLPFPILFSILSKHITDINISLNLEKYFKKFNEKTCFNFLLLRDDDTSSPVFEIKDSSCKIMTIFSEFGNSFIKIAENLRFNVLEFSSGNISGQFFLKVQFPPLVTLGELIRIIGLLRASLEILSCVRGFKIYNFCFGDFLISYDFIKQLECELS